ncbi:hypothetical protein LAJ19_16215 (plasmid) [Deinococcus taeanensis]|uniref:hypothetical protein n=1 Tax=Deinococcus taeanensis TaxID=2737050 RepID=UPI001CDC4BD0|nr:hypothetical protein [Deinococcus taeanensis]UBV44704.1 hypothetical protein LAJ19_16215 [Deinococcus taeanensis]
MTGGASTPACIAAATLAGAIMSVEVKTRQRQDAAIKIESAQLAITQWKSGDAT